MTADTVVLYGLVYEIIFLKLILHDDMAGKTELRLRGNQQVCMVGAVRFVTYRTFADGCWAVQKRKSFGNLMAVFAKSGDRFFLNQKLVVTAVGIVALHTITSFYGLVNDLLGGLLQMTVFAKVSAFPLQLPCVLFRFKRFMASSAVAEADWAVNVCFFAVLRMTFFCNTCLLHRSRFFHREAVCN